MSEVKRVGIKKGLEVIQSLWESIWITEVVQQQGLKDLVWHYLSLVVFPIASSTSACCTWSDDFTIPICTLKSYTWDYCVCTTSSFLPSILCLPGGLYLCVSFWPDTSTTFLLAGSPLSPPCIVLGFALPLRGSIYLNINTIIANNKSNKNN